MELVDAASERPRARARKRDMLLRFLLRQPSPEPTAASGCKSAEIDVDSLPLSVLVSAATAAQATPQIPLSTLVLEAIASQSIQSLQSREERRSLAMDGRIAFRIGNTGEWWIFACKVCMHGCVCVCMRG